MAFQATVFNVMIASPTDVQKERDIVREVVHEWNAVNASTRRAVLLPVGWETHSTPLIGERPQTIINWQVLKDSDLLIAAFWTRLGTPTGKAPSGTVEEIAEHIKVGKPALLYFSSAPVAPEGLGHDQYQALRTFKEAYMQLGTYETYESQEDFHEKVRRHLGLTLNNHPYFKALLEASPNSARGATGISKPKMSTLSPEARQLLLEAVAGGGDVVVRGWIGGSMVQANGKNFVELNNPRSRAIWEEAVRELSREDLLQNVGQRGEVFRVTRRGYEMADQLKP